MGTDVDYVAIRSWPVASGPISPSSDVRSAAQGGGDRQDHRHHAVRRRDDPVGQVIRVKSAPFMIVGVLGPRAMSMMGQDQDDVVLVPYTQRDEAAAGATTSSDH